MAKKETAEESAKALKQQTQSTLTMAKQVAVAEIRASAAAAGVGIVALSATYNMIHPDPAVRADGLRQLGVMLGAARARGRVGDTLHRQPRRR